MLAGMMHILMLPQLHLLWPCCPMHMSRLRLFSQCNEAALTMQRPFFRQIKYYFVASENNSSKKAIGCGLPPGGVGKRLLAAQRKVYGAANCLDVPPHSPWHWYDWPAGLPMADLEYGLKGADEYTA